MESTALPMSPGLSFVAVPAGAMAVAIYQAFQQTKGVTFTPSSGSSRKEFKVPRLKLLQIAKGLTMLHYLEEHGKIEGEFTLFTLGRKPD